MICAHCKKDIEHNDSVPRPYWKHSVDHSMECGFLNALGRIVYADPVPEGTLNGLDEYEIYMEDITTEKCPKCGSCAHDHSCNLMGWYSCENISCEMENFGGDWD